MHLRSPHLRIHMLRTSLFILDNFLSILVMAQRARSMYYISIRYGTTVLKLWNDKQFMTKE